MPYSHHQKWKMETENWNPFIQMNFNMSSKLHKIKLESARAFMRETILNCDIRSFIHLKNLSK